MGKDLYKRSEDEYSIGEDKVDGELKKLHESFIVPLADERRSEDHAYYASVLG